jgi:hypothetical protein
MPPDFASPPLDARERSSVDVAVEGTVRVEEVGEKRVDEGRERVLVCGAMEKVCLSVLVQRRTPAGWLAVC